MPLLYFTKAERTSSRPTGCLVIEFPAFRFFHHMTPNDPAFCRKLHALFTSTALKSFCRDRKDLTLSKNMPKISATITEVEN